MKKLMISAAALMIAVAAHGQGQFLFNTRDIAAGNNVTFMFNGALATGTDLFVEVLAGKDAASLVPLAGTLPLNRTGAGAGYTSPFSNIYTVPGLAGGTSALVGYRAFQGATYAASSAKSELQLATANVTLSEPPTPPNEVALGVKSVSFAVIPEPATLALGLLGLGSLLMFRRRS
jgi:hypothetical protein